jgi:serine/threonine protein kinase
LANDIWALGVTFYELAAGTLPWSVHDKAGMLREILLGVMKYPVSLDQKIGAAITSMLRVDPNLRPSVQQL